MDGAAGPGGEVLPAPSLPEPEALSAKDIFRQYYTDKDFVLSPEGILKLFSVIMCIVSAVLLLSRGSCSDAPALPQSAGYIALACGALVAVLYGLVVLQLSLYAPQLCLFTDIILSTVMGALLLLMAVLTMTVCEMREPLSYVHGPVGIVNAGMLLTSTIIKYVTVMRYLDASRPNREPHRPPPSEQEV